MTVNTDTATDSDRSDARPDEVETDFAATTSGGVDADGGDVDDSTDEAIETGSETTDSEDPRTDREAAKYRRQLRDTEAERDRLLTQVEGYHRAEVERLASSRLINGSDVWAGGLQLTDVLADDGSVNPALVKQAVADLAQSRPHWARQAAAPASAVTSAGKPDTSGGQRASTWGDVLSRATSGAVEG